VPKELFRFYRAANHPEEKKGGAAVSRTIEAAAAFRSARKSSLSLSLSLDDPGRTPRWSNQVGFYRILGDMRNARTRCLETGCVLQRERFCPFNRAWNIRLTARFCSGALNNCRHECDKYNLCSIQFRRDTVNDNGIDEGRGAKANRIVRLIKIIIRMFLSIRDTYFLGK